MRRTDGQRGAFRRREGNFAAQPGEIAIVRGEDDRASVARVGGDSLLELPPTNRVQAVRRLVEEDQRRRGTMQPLCATDEES